MVLRYKTDNIVSGEGCTIKKKKKYTETQYNIHYPII